MPRLNIEDEWFDDPRREALIGKIGIVTDAVAIRMWRLAQTYYRVGALVPRHLFDQVPHAQDFAAAGLVEFVDAPSKLLVHEGKSYELKGPGVYIRGQKDRFAWLKARSDAGQRGGQARGGGAKQPPEVRKDRVGREMRPVTSRTKEGAWKCPEYPVKGKYKLRTNLEVQ